MIDPQTLRMAETHLAGRDRRLRRLIEAHGPCRLGQRRRDPFHVLCASIISQQLSTKAADAIMARVAVAAGARNRFMPRHFLSVDLRLLRDAGLSNAKARWLTALAKAVDGGELDFKALRKQPDERALEVLDALPGIGRWTAEMFLIFALDRLDIFSISDVGLRRALDHLHNGGGRLDDGAARRITQRWIPYRSVASWYLWRLTDGDVGTWT
ncbi:MAG: DNA-3-methyladenine glycosylase 2 family protein [Gammaproteobacteria bacterium]|nr:DNA-3-methyladenine glycosylase 2 family protein [Gammaproteobacteria bacterium]